MNIIPKLTARVRFGLTNRHAACITEKLGTKLSLVESVVIIHKDRVTMKHSTVILIITP